MKSEIKDLKKGDNFIFNDTFYTVKKKYRNDDSPLKTECGHLFHHEGLEVTVPDKPRGRRYK